MTIDERVRQIIESGELDELTLDVPASCARWLSFLSESVGDADEIEILQEFFGYCLLSKNNFERALMIVGPIASGKTLIARLLSDLVGGGSTTFFPWDELDNPFRLGRLSASHLNCSEGLPGKFDAATIKAIVSGEPLRGAHMGQPSFDFVPRCKLVVLTGHAPAGIQEPGFARRLLTVSTRRQFVDGEADPGLYRALSAEKPGIFAWALIGLERLLRRKGFVEVR